MSYETPGEVLLGIYNKLLRQRDNNMRKLRELTLQIKLLGPEYQDSRIYEKLEKDRVNTEDKLADVELQLSVINKKRNGGASLDPFLSDETLQKVEDELNATTDYDVDIKRR